MTLSLPDAAAAARPGQGARCSLSDGGQAQLQSALAELDLYGALGAVLVVEGPGQGRAVFTHGHADPERKVAMTADRRFMVGSQTKMFTAAGILLLAKQGKLGLDDKVSQYVTGVAGDPDVTMRHLLTHMSGIGDGIVYFDPPAPWSREHFTIDELLTLCRVVGRESAPGERFAYNNLAYIILGEVIHRVSGQTREAFIATQIFKPLKMTASFLGTAAAWPRDRMARGFQWNEKRGLSEETTDPASLDWAGGAGDMISSADDLLTWWRALGDPRNPTGLVLDDFIAYTVPVPDTPVMSRYGYGVALQSANGIPVWGHGGIIHGYVTMTVLEPETGVRASILLNMRGDKTKSLGRAAGAMTGVIGTAVTLAVRDRACR